MDPQRITDFLVPERAVRWYLLILTLVFAAAFPAGIYAPFSGGKEMAEALNALAGQYVHMAGGALFLFILLNNVFASLLLLLLGLLAGVIPFLSVGFNGFVLGLIFRHAAEAVGYEEAALNLVPHAVFEIPALLLTASYGVWLGVGVIRRVRRKEAAPIGPMLNHAFERYFSVVFPLLIVAAAIETILILRGS
jgi:stage II sporulation protein M